MMCLTKIPTAANLLAESSRFRVLVRAAMPGAGGFVVFAIVGVVKPIRDDLASATDAVAPAPLPCSRQPALGCADAVLIAGARPARSSYLAAYERVSHLVEC